MELLLSAALSLTLSTSVSIDPDYVSSYLPGAMPQPSVQSTEHVMPNKLSPWYEPILSGGSEAVWPMPSGGSRGRIWPLDRCPFCPAGQKAAPGNWLHGF